MPRWRFVSTPRPFAKSLRTGCPLAYAAFEDYRLGGASLSARGVDCVRRMAARGGGDAGDERDELRGSGGSLWDYFPTNSKRASYECERL